MLATHNCSLKNETCELKSCNLLKEKKMEIFQIAIMINSDSLCAPETFKMFILEWCNILFARSVSGPGGLLCIHECVCELSRIWMAVLRSIVLIYTPSPLPRPHTPRPQLHNSHVNTSGLQTSALTYSNQESFSQNILSLRLSFCL